MKKVLLVLIVVLFVAAVYEPARWALLSAVGRGNGCPPYLAWKVVAEKKELTAVKDKLLANSRLIERDGKLELWETPYGRFWTPEGSQYILPFNLAEQETKIYARDGRGVRAGDVVLDCGANVGVYTREALTAGARLVVAIEPAPDNIECLRRTFAKEIAEGKVLLYPKGVWDKDDVLEFRVDPKNQAADSFVINREGSEVVARLPLTSIDKMVGELKLERVDYIKMDIEGAEVKATEGARNTIAKWHPRMALSVYHQADHPDEVPRAALAAWAGYHTACGPCNAEGFTVRPDVVYFY